MGSAWDTYNDQDLYYNWCKKHGFYAGGGLGCTKCHKQREEEKKAAQDKAKEILRAAGFDLSTISFSPY